MTDTSGVLWLWQLWVVYAALAVIGAVLIGRAVFAYRSKPSGPLLMLGLGLGLLVVGTPVGWTMLYFTTGDMFLCTLGAAAVSLAGAAVLLTSVYWRRA